MLPGFVRELILHDRGNSIYLSDSFANLPSPVNETQNLKQLFKPKENEEDLNRNRKKDKKDSNVEIRIEGKESKEKDKSIDESYDKKANANIDVKDIEKIVFQKPVLPGSSENVYSNIPVGSRSRHQSNLSAGSSSENQLGYVEEESYVNPPNIDNISEDDQFPL